LLKKTVHGLHQVAMLLIAAEIAKKLLEVAETSCNSFGVPARRAKSWP